MPAPTRIRRRFGALGLLARSYWRVRASISRLCDHSCVARCFEAISIGLPGDSLSNPERHAEIIARLRKLRSDSSRQWGRMSPHQAICHLSDALRVVLGEAPLPPATDNWFNRNIIRWIALHTPLPWPRGGAKAPQGLDQVAGEGTRPGDFDADRDELIALHARFAALPGLPTVSAHPIFGPLSRNEWMVWAYRHSDHHLRQFGV